MVMQVSQETGIPIDNNVYIYLISFKDVFILNEEDNVFKDYVVVLNYQKNGTPSFTFRLCDYKHLTQLKHLEYNYSIQQFIYGKDQDSLIMNDSYEIIRKKSELETYYFLRLKTVSTVNNLESETTMEIFLFSILNKKLSCIANNIRFSDYFAATLNLFKQRTNFVASYNLYDSAKILLSEDEKEYKQIKQTFLNNKKLLKKAHTEASYYMKVYEDTFKAFFNS